MNLTFVLVIGSIRISTLFFYRRIFLGRSFIIAWWIVVVATALWTVIFFFTSVFQCGTNFSAFWGSFAYAGEHCFYIFGEVVALAVTDVALDVAVLGLPLPYVNTATQKLSKSFANIGTGMEAADAQEAEVRHIVYLLAWSVFRRCWRYTHGHEH